MRFTFVNTLVEIAKKDRDVIVLLGDLGYGMFDPFFNELPEQIINVGIAEQSMTGLAAGLALEGKKVFTYGTCNFPTMRCLEQIRNDCAYQKANVKIVSANCGLAFKAHGMSHYATEDLAVMRALPNVTVVAPADPVESELLTEAIYKQQGTCYLRLGKGAEPTIYKEKINNYVLGKAIKIIEGKKIVFFSTGSITHEVLKAIELLNTKDIYPALFSFPTVKPIDKKLIIECSKQYDFIISVEEHNIIGGFGSAIAEVLAEIPNCHATLKRFGLEDVYPEIVGTQEYLLNIYGISAEKIFDRTLSLIV
jgi:transketolase